MLWVLVSAGTPNRCLALAAEGAGILEPGLARLTGLGMDDDAAGPTVAYLTGALSALPAGMVGLTEGGSLSGITTGTRRGPFVDAAAFTGTTLVAVLALEIVLILGPSETKTRLGPSVDCVLFTIEDVTAALFTNFVCCPLAMP